MEEIDLDISLKRKWEMEERGEGEDWVERVVRRAKAGDLEGVKREGLMASQMVMVDLLQAEEAVDRYRAAAFLLGQSGQGEVRKVEHTMDYEGMPMDQLAAIVRSKLEKLREVVPGIAEGMVLEGEVVSGEE